MSNMFTSRLFKSNILWALLGAAVLTLVLLALPRVSSHIKAEAGCTAYDTARFNPFPVSWSSEAGTNCMDFPVIAGDVVGWHTWMDNMNAGIGDEVYVRVYMHNGAASNSEQVLHNAGYSVSYDQSSGSQHAVTASIFSNEDSKTGRITINTPEGAHLELVGGDPLSQNIGDMQPCFEYSRAFFMTFRVVADQVVTPPPAQNNASGNLTAELKQNICPATIHLSWNTSNAGGMAIFDSNNQPVPGTATDHGDIDVTSIQPGNSYTYTLWSVNWVNGQPERINQLAQQFVSVPANVCQAQQPPSQQSFNLSITPSAVCVNQVSSVSITNATSGLEGRQVQWTSWHNEGGQAVPTGENQAGYGQVISNGSWSGQTNPWTSSQTGAWTKRASFVDQNGNVLAYRDADFTVLPSTDSRCGGTPPPTVQPTPTATINATLGSKIDSQCLWNATVTWSTTNVGHPKVYVKSIVSPNEQLMAYSDNGTANPNWIGPNDLVTFTLRGDNISDKTATVDTRGQSCNTTPTTFTATASASATATAACPAGSSSASAHASASATATATSTISQQDAQNKAQAQAQQDAQSKAQAQANASVSVSCTPAPTQCISNTNGSIAIDSVSPTNSPYSTNVRWSSTGNNGIIIYMNGSTPITSGTANGSVQVNNLQPGTNYSFSAKDSVCGGIIASNSIVVSQVQQTTQTNNCTSSTCINQNNNTQQTSTGNQSPNQSNSSNINGNNNTVTQTNNNCVNNSCNNTNSVYYVTAAGTTVTYTNFSQLSITKLVRNATTGTSLSSSVTANNGDMVEFQITVSNSGGQTASNVRVTDNIPSGLSFQGGSTYMNGSYVSDSFTNGGSMYLGSLASGSSKTITFRAQVNSNSSASIQNTATAVADNASQVQASAWVFVNPGNVAGGNVNLILSKRAFNETKNSDATIGTASKQDYITYTLTVQNNGNAPASSFVITDDLSQVLPYADMVDNGGGTLNGNVISYPGINIPAGGSVSKSFKVRVKFFLADNLSYVMSNTYGNTVTVKINQPQVLGAFVAPKTGADTLGFVFAGLLTAGFGVMKKRKFVANLILNN